MKPRTLAEIPPGARGVPYRTWLAQRTVCTPQDIRRYHEAQARLAAQIEAEAEKKSAAKRPRSQR